METRNRDTIRIWFATTEQLGPLLEQDPCTVFACVSTAEWKRYDETVNRQTRLQFLLGRFLVPYAQALGALPALRGMCSAGNGASGCAPHFALGF